MMPVAFGGGAGLQLLQLAQQELARIDPRHRAPALGPALCAFATGAVLFHLVMTAALSALVETFVAGGLDAAAVPPFGIEPRLQLGGLAAQASQLISGRQRAKLGAGACCWR